MKKTFSLFLLTIGVTLVSCEYQPVEVGFNASNFMLMNGDSAVFEVHHAKSVEYSYSDFRDEETPVFEISKSTGESTTIYARNVGTDTLWVSYNWSQGIYDYGHLAPVVITVLEK